MSEQPERLVRTFDAELSEGDGRTILARIAPYNVEATVSDPPDYTPYQEMFLQGAFERQTSAPNRVRMWLNFEHEQGLRGIVGHGIDLEDREDGLHAKFRVHENADGEKALELVHEGLLTGVSAEFMALRTRVVNGVQQRVRAHIDRVSLCRPERSAYKEAAVLAVRTFDNLEDEDLPIPFDPGLAELMEQAGIAVPDRLRAASK